MKISLVNYAIYVPLAIVLIPRYRVVGLIIASIVAGFSSNLYGLHIIRRDFRLEVVVRRNITVVGALSLPAAAAWLTSFLLFSSTIVEFLLGVTVYLVSLTLILPAVIRRSEVLELIEITKSVKPLSFIAPKALSAILAISDLLNSARNRFSASKYS
jgi:O-antigen/teichoic acid export membrane protein